MLDNNASNNRNEVRDVVWPSKTPSPHAFADTSSISAHNATHTTHSSSSSSSNEPLSSSQHQQQQHAFVDTSSSINAPPSLDEQLAEDEEFVNNNADNDAEEALIDDDDVVAGQDDDDDDDDELTNADLLTEAEVTDFFVFDFLKFYFSFSLARCCSPCLHIC